MQTFELTLALLLGATMLSGIARRLRLPYPALLALGGAALAFWSKLPDVYLDPNLALALFVAPVLLDAAFDTSLRDLKDNWLPIGSLVVFSVITTTIAVAGMGHWLMPGMPWGAAIALGAIVAPPDAAAAVAVLRNVRLPHRVLTILEGESLLNDATALLIYRAAVKVTLGQANGLHHETLAILWALSGSIVGGYVLGQIGLRVLTRVKQVPSAIVLQFVSTFGVWLLAERLHWSAVLTVVVYGMSLARLAPLLQPARMRVPSYAVWETVVFVLNVLAFVLVGLQMRPIWQRLGSDRWHQVWVALAILATTIVARTIWVMSFNKFARWKRERFGEHGERRLTPPTIRGGLIISWCGMRGIVTLAASLALPDGRDGAPMFPYRDQIIFAAFCVVIGTLVLQGFTLRPLLRVMALRDDGQLAKERRQAQSAALRAGLKALGDDNSLEACRVRREYEDSLRAIEAAPADGSRLQLTSDDPRRRALAAARRSIGEMRSNGDIGDETFHQVEEYLDWAELAAGGQEAE